MGVARKNIVLSEGWRDDQFRRVGAVAGSANVTYRTLPVLRFDTVDGQAVNIIDPAAIRAQAGAAFGQDVASAPTVQAAPSSTVDVVNAGDTKA
jgi:hypothetical protein